MEKLPPLQQEQELMIRDFERNAEEKANGIWICNIYLF